MKTAEEHDHGPKILPPHFFLLALLLMVALRFLAPGPIWIPVLLRYLGLPLLLAGLLLVVYVAGLFRRAGTTIRPFQASSALVATGPFRVSRNPIYVGMVIGLLGVALMLGALTPFLVIPAFAFLIDRLFIRAEEVGLEGTFGQSYRDYKAKVRRWV